MPPELQCWQQLQLFGMRWLQQAAAFSGVTQCVLRVGPLVIWEKTLIRKEIQREWADTALLGLQCLPQALFPSVLSHGGSCPGDFRRELLRCACQQRWTSLETCSSNTHTEKKKSRLFLTLRQFYSESSFVLWLFLDCQIAVSALHKAPKTWRLWGMARMGHYRARTTLPFRGEKLKDVG